MEKEPCPGLEDLEALLRLSSADPRRRHLDDCPRCRARVLTFLEFTEPPRDIPPHVLRDAESRLDAALKRELALEGGRRESAPAAFPRWLAGWRLSRGGLAWAAAAIAIGVVVVSLQGRRSRQEAPFLLRGSAEHAAPGAASPLTLRSAAGPSGVQLSWSPVPGADAYEVRLYGPSLEEIARLHPVTEPRILLSHADLPPSAAAGAPALWKVVALHGGDSIAESAPSELRLP
ncbi:MAG: hypothetical protein U0167_09055 [bacterium]